MSEKIRSSALDVRPPSATWRVIAVLAAVVVLVLWVVFGGAETAEILRKLLALVDRWGFWGMIVFVVGYILATVLLIPGSVLTLGAGAVFGLGTGFVLVSLGSTAGAAAAFLVGRHVARDRVALRVGHHPMFQAIDGAVSGEGWKVVLLTRLSPVFPFTLLNYAFGLTRIPFGSYLLASWVGMMPGTLMYVYLGSVVQVGAGPSRTPVEWALYGMGLLATVAVVVLVTRRARAALARTIQRQGGPSVAEE